MSARDFDNTQAEREGWAIFDCDGSDNGPYQIQRDDSAEAFDSDDAVWEHVAHQATQGSAYHRSAIEYIRVNNPIEYGSFCKFTGYRS